MSSKKQDRSMDHKRKSEESSISDFFPSSMKLATIRTMKRRVHRSSLFRHWRIACTAAIIYKINHRRPRSFYGLWRIALSLLPPPLPNPVNVPRSLLPLLPFFIYSLVEALTNEMLAIVRPRDILFYDRFAETPFSLIPANLAIP